MLSPGRKGALRSGRRGAKLRPHVGGVLLWAIGASLRGHRSLGAPASREALVGRETVASRTRTRLGAGPFWDSS